MTPTTTEPNTPPSFKLVDLIQLPLDSIKQGINPRTEFDQAKLTELAQSLKDDNGPVQPIVVYHDEDGRYGLIAGERRWRAAKLAGLESILSVVRPKPASHQARKFALKENMQREDLTPLEVATAVKEMLEETNDFGVPIYSKTQLADELGKQPLFVNWCEELLNCSERLKLKVHHGKVPLEIAAMIGSLPADMHEMAETDIVYRPNGCMTRDQAREHIAEKFRRDLRKGQFDKAAADLVPGRPACKDCDRCGARRDDVKGKHKDSVCLNPVCFDLKQRAYVQTIMDHSDEGDGVTLLPETMRDRVFSFDGKTVKGDSGYVAADEVPDKGMLVDRDAKLPKWAEIVEGKGVKEVTILDNDGRVRTLYPADVALQAAVHQDSKWKAMFKTTGATVTGASATSVTAKDDSAKKAAEEKARANGVIAAGQSWVQCITASADMAATSREIFRLILERLTEAADRDWMGKVMGVKDLMDAGDKGMMTEVLALSLVARAMRLQGPGSIGGTAGALCKLAGFDPKKAARDVEALVEKAGKPEKKAKTEELFTCEHCGTANFTKRGLKSHNCERRQAEKVESEALPPETIVVPAKKKAREICSKRVAPQRGGKRVADPAAEKKAWSAYLKTGSIAEAAKACGLDVESVKNWHKRREWRAKREAALKK